MADRNEQPTKAIKKVSDQVVEVQEGQTITAARIRVHLVEASERARDEALAQADKEPRFDERERLREQAVKAHEIRLSRIDDLAASFVELEQRPDSSPVLREMIADLERREDQPGRQGDRLRGAAAAGPAGAGSRPQAGRTRTESGGARAAVEGRVAGTDPRPARCGAGAVYQELLELEPDWPQALESFAYFLFDQSVQIRVSRLASRPRWPMPSNRSSWRNGSSLPGQLEAGRPRGSSSVACNQLGDVLIRGPAGRRRAGAASTTMRSLELDEGLLKQNPDSAQAARDVSVSLNKLGDFLAQRGQPGDAERALRR